MQLPRKERPAAGTDATQEESTQAREEHRQEAATSWPPLRDHTDWVLEGWKQQRPDLDVSPLAVINRLSRLQSYLQPEIAAVFVRFGLTLPPLL